LHQQNTQILADIWTLLMPLVVIRFLFINHIWWWLIERYTCVEIQGYETTYYYTSIRVRIVRLLTPTANPVLYLFFIMSTNCIMYLVVPIKRFIMSVIPPCCVIHSFLWNAISLPISDDMMPRYHARLPVGVKHIAYLYKLTVLSNKRWLLRKIWKPITIIIIIIIKIVHEVQNKTHKNYNSKSKRNTLVNQIPKQ